MDSLLKGFSVSILLILLPGQAGAVFTGSLLPVDRTVPTGEVDIIAEANTYVPRWYRGRSEPATGSDLRLIAMPVDAPTGALNYHWNVNGSTIKSTDSVISVATPIHGDMRVSLRVFTENGSLWAEKNEVVSLSKPEIIFFEDNLLRGTSRVSIGSDYTLIGEESTIKAEAFFLEDILDSPQLMVNWEVNGRPIDDVDSDWRTLLITRSEDDRARQVEMELIHPTRLLEGIKASFSLGTSL